MFICANLWLNFLMPQNPIIIRPALETDYAAFIALYIEINNFHAAEHPEVFAHIQQPPKTPEEFLSMIHDPSQAVFVAEVEGQVIGWTQVILREAPPLVIMTPRRFGVVDTLVVGAGFRRRGIGRALMERAEEWARQQGIDTLELGVWEFNKGAIALYEELGYRTFSRKMRKRIGKSNRG